MTVRANGWRIVLAGCLVVMVLAALPVPTTAAPLRGKLDGSFGRRGRVFYKAPPSFAESAYMHMVRQPDGALLLAGETETVRGKYFEPGGFLQRRLPDGAIDPAFHELRGGRIGGLALESDGRVLLSEPAPNTCASSSNVRRLDPDGTADTSFGKNGVASVGFAAELVAVDGAGRTILAGRANDNSCGHDPVATYAIAVARLLPNGSRDPSFGHGGEFVDASSAGLKGGPTGLIVRADGSIVVAGEHSLIGLTAGGAPDPAFGEAGFVKIENFVDELTETTSGVLIAAGGTAQFCCHDSGPFLLRAFHPDGSVDSTWGSGGEVKIQIADVDLPTALTPGPEGSLLLAGEASPADEPTGCKDCRFAPYVARLNAAGSVDPGFAPNLPETPEALREVGPTKGFPSRVAAIALAPSGQVLLAGRGKAGEDQATVTALSASGAVESGFGDGGTAATPQPLPSRSELRGLAVGPGQSVVAKLWSDSGAYEDQLRIEGWGRNGKPIGGYGGNVDFDRGRASPYDGIATDRQGRVYRTGESLLRTETFVLRAGQEGRADPGYGDAGQAPLPLNFEVEQLLVRPDGAAMVIGRIDKQKQMAFFQLTPDGQPDPGFGKDGLARVAWGKVKADALSAALDRRGRLIAFGTVGREAAFLRLLPDGGLDPSFGRGGRQTHLPDLYVDISRVAITRAGLVYLATSSERRGQTTLVRLREDGSRDDSFGRRGVVRVGAEGHLLALFAAGREAVVVNQGRGPVDDGGVAIRALGPRGSREPAFGRHGLLEVHGFEPVAAVRAPTGRIVIGGKRDSPLPGEKIELVGVR
jgi:uncharacterized delta-60 repeat protein